jgi:transcriptional regulator with XRE-family HTH domain
MARTSNKALKEKSVTAVGAAIRSLREENDLSQEALAHAAGIDRSYLGGIERGEHNVALINLHRIAVALKVKISEVMVRAGV